MLCLSTVYYAWLAYRIAKATGRTDVCALPSGVSVPHMFVVTFVIMLPIALKTGDPVKGWEAGLTWVFMQSFVLMVGGFIAPLVRKITPRAALLGTLAGVSITFISMKPALEMFSNPVIGITCFALILLNWFGGVRYRGVPAGLIAIGVGTALAWLSSAVGWHFGGLTLKGLADSVTNFGFHLPLPAVGHVFSGFQFLGLLLITAIPFGIYDLVEAIDNVESAAVAGDQFPNHSRAHGRWDNQPDRLHDGKSVHQRRLHRTSGLESNGRTHWLLRGHGNHGRALVLVWNDFAHVGFDSDRRHSADSVVHRYVDWFASVPGDTEGACACHRFVTDAASGELGRDAHQWRAGRFRDRGGSIVSDALQELVVRMKNEGVFTTGSRCWAEARSSVA